MKKTSARIMMIACLTAALVAGCAAPEGNFPSSPDMKMLDKETEYQIVAKPTGFLVVLNHAKAQYAADFGAIISKCKDAVSIVANDHAESLHRRIRAVDQQRIQYTTDRQLSGLTLCSATYLVEWAR